MTLSCHEEFETTPIIGEEDLVKEDHVDEPEDGAAKDERLKQSLWLSNRSR